MYGSYFKLIGLRHGLPDKKAGADSVYLLIGFTLAF